MDQFARRISSVKKIINAKNRSLDIGHSDKKHHEGKLFYHLFLKNEIMFIYVQLMNNNNACIFLTRSFKLTEKDHRYCIRYNSK